MHSTRTLSIVAIFTSTIIASDYALAPLLNVKLLDTLVFSSSYAFGFRVGASIAILSELIWSVMTPYGGGFQLSIIPFLVIGEILYALMGYFASKIWGVEKLSLLSHQNLYFGSILAICAFIWDFETNIATGLIALWPNITIMRVLVYEIFGIPFMIPHELSDFVLGAALAPIIIVYCRQLAMRSGKTHPTAQINSEVR
ncbi:MAG: hypothetical protein ACREBS_08740 [Nitrososphaerales archaeon]